MTHTRRSALLAALTVLTVCGGIAACGNKSTNDSKPQLGEGAALPTNTSRTLPPSTRPIGAECDDASVKKAVSDTYPDVKVSDRFCTTTFAIATVFPAGGNKKGIVVFMGADGDNWKLLKETPADSDVKAAAPPDFPESLIDKWKGSYVDPTKPSSTTTAGGSGDCPLADNSCESTTTTAKPTTTSSTTSTTAKPTTTTQQVTTTTKASGGLG